MSTPAILYIHDLRGSGVVTNAIALARSLGAERETILVAGYGTGLNRHVDVSPARLVVLDEGPEPTRPRVKAARALRRVMHRTGAGLVMSMGNFGHSTVFAATRWSRARTVYRVSNEIGRPRAGFRNFRRRNWQRLLLATADRIVLVGRALAEQPLFKRAVHDGKAAYIANGVDVGKARRERDAAVPHAWFEDGGPPVVLAIGRIHPQKNLEGLFAGVALAMRETPLRLLVVGSGPPDRVAALKVHAKDLGIDAALQFAGETDNVFAWLARAQAFALVSHWEGSSTALLEAMAVGVPVVASRQAGDARFVLDEGRYGVLVDGKDPASIAAGLLQQLGDHPITSGDRVDHYRLSVTHQRYLDLIRPL